ncbi:hypothetical protein [uncultured Algibacter sp.]|uniref:hypothetical protein n=1 Tax=uncultured Algibacter sp. TaxID=298659 RepID=UPI00260D4E0B|nr:hypothetical protein [uncultured Algibacter sp.]
MIKFFRKIRQQLLSENKISKYLLYAVGEIILVVIGILLALNINNRNQQKISEAKITNILKEIQQDIVSDVRKSKIVFDKFIMDDSIQNLILNNRYTFNDFKSGKAETLGTNYDDFVINTIGYDNLMRNIDNVPEKYQPIINDLKYLYVVKTSNINVYNVRIRETVYKNIDYLFSTNDWNLDALRGITSDEAINYYLNNSKYKNMVALYMNDRENIFNESQLYCHVATETYYKIAKLLKSTDSIPEILASKSKNASFLNSIVGHYKLKGSTGSEWAENIKITNDANELRLIDKYRDDKLIYHRGFIFVIYSSQFNCSSYIQFNKPKFGELYISDGISGNATYIKEE